MGDQVNAFEVVVEIPEDDQELLGLVTMMLDRMGVKYDSRVTLKYEATPPAKGQRR